MAEAQRSFNAYKKKQEDKMKILKDCGLYVEFGSKPGFATKEKAKRFLAEHLTKSIMAGDLFIGYDEIYCVDCGEYVVASYGDDPDDFFDMA